MQINYLLLSFFYFILFTEPIAFSMSREINPSLIFRTEGALGLRKSQRYKKHSTDAINKLRTLPFVEQLIYYKRHDYPDTVTKWVSTFHQNDSTLKNLIMGNLLLQESECATFLKKFEDHLKAGIYFLGTHQQAPPPAHPLYPWIESYISQVKRNTKEHSSATRSAIMIDICKHTSLAAFSLGMFITYYKCVTPPDNIRYFQYLKSFLFPLTALAGFVYCALTESMEGVKKFKHLCNYSAVKTQATLIDTSLNTFLAKIQPPSNISQQAATG